MIYKKKYEGKISLNAFMNWICDDMLGDQASIDPRHLWVSEELAIKLGKSPDFSPMLWVNKGPKVIHGLRGNEVIYDEENDPPLVNAEVGKVHASIKKNEEEK